LKPWQKQQWCIAKVTSDFIWRMEDVLDLYAEPYKSKKPVVCFDETSKQLLSEVHSALPMEPGKPQRVDYEYHREGTANLFLFSEPLSGWRHLEVTEQRTKRDFAQQMKVLVDVHYPQAEVIRLVCDNLNTHSPASLYEAFSPEEARRITQKLEFHYTPKHGSWLNMAEMEFSLLSRQCLGRRIPNRVILAEEVAAWEAQRNEAKAKINWMFRVEDARTKLNRLYPDYHNSCG
jgi:hypothetical protein